MAKVPSLEDLAGLVRETNSVAAKIATVIGRPAQIGHVGEYIASQVFDIELHASAATKGSDGVFRRGPLAGRTVDVKWYTKHECLLDVRKDALPDYYLVFTGPSAPAGSSRGLTRPWVIKHVFLFPAARLVADLSSRGVCVGTAANVPADLWSGAEVYPTGTSSFPLSNDQIASLALFS